MICNAHEHVAGPAEMKEYLRVMADVGIARTVFVGSGNATIYNCPPHGFTGWRERNLALLTENPDSSRLLVAPCLDPQADDGLDLLYQYLDLGARALKLYHGLASSHFQGPWHTAPLDAPKLRSVFEHCAATRLPVLFHVNRVTFYEELLRFLEAYPGINVCFPHLMVSSASPHRLGRVAAVLDRYPNVYTDLSHGQENHLLPFCESITKRTDEFRAFFNRYSDRILWGTDLVITEPKLHRMGSYVEAMTRWYRSLVEADEWQSEGSAQDRRTREGQAPPAGEERPGDTRADARVLG